MGIDPFGHIMRETFPRVKPLRRIKRLVIASSRGFDWAYYCWKRLIQTDAALHSIQDLVATLNSEQHHLYIALMNRILQLDPYQRSDIWHIVSHQVLEVQKRSDTNSESLA